MASNSEEQLQNIEQLKEAFDKADKNKDGKINKVEFRDAMKSLEVLLNDEELKELMKQVSNSRSIDFNEFVSVAVVKLNEHTHESVLEQFQLLDCHEEGCIEYGKFKKMMCQRGEKMSEEEFQQMMSYIKLEGSQEPTFNYNRLLSNVQERHPVSAFKKLD